MNRRDVLPLLTAGLWGSSARTEAPPRQASIIKPPALRPGDTVGLLTPATFMADPDKLAAADRTVRWFGLVPRFAGNVRKRSGYLGGSVEERVADLHELFADPAVKAVFAIRGGYGSAQLLDRLDYGLIRRNPKIFVGFSDITAMHLAIHRETGLVTFHGPIVLAGFTQFTQDNFRRMLFEAKAAGRLTNPPEANKLRPLHTLRTVRPGTARGRLIGGNLTIIATTMGTPWEIDTRGRILFIEDVDEQPYSIDRMLTQLRLSGKLEAAAGIIFGECRDCKPREFRPAFEATFSTGEVVNRILGELRVPVLAGLTIGHTDDQLTLPIGCMAALDADKGELVIEEPAVL